MRHTYVPHCTFRVGRKAFPRSAWE
ncbi:hypothetical protein F4W67_18715 [Pseudomonas caricapapayae]|nr:hypothetical protein F4W67_18715 [Pseudomonas caricapapayae]